MPINWEELSKTFGFENEKEMLEEFYHKQNWSVSKIAKRIKTGTSTIISKMIKLGIERRGKGGPNNSSVPEGIKGLTRDELMNAKINDLVKKTGLSMSTILRYRRKIRLGGGV